jgi:hypothetical protein
MRRTSTCAASVSGSSPKVEWTSMPPPLSVARRAVMVLFAPFSVLRLSASRWVIAILCNAAGFTAASATETW